MYDRKLGRLGRYINLLFLWIWWKVGDILYKGSLICFVNLIVYLFNVGLL